MRVDDVPDGLPRNHLLEGFHHRDRSRLGFRSLYDDNMIPKFHRDTPGTARRAPDAIRDLLRLDDLGHRRRRLPDACRHLECGGDVRLHVGNRHVEYRISALSLDNVGWEFHTTEIFVISEDGFERRVAKNRIIEPRYDPFDEVLLIQQSFELCLVRSSE